MFEMFNSQEQLDQLIGLIPGPTAIVDRDGVVQHVNAAMVSLCCRSKETLVGSLWSSLIAGGTHNLSAHSGGDTGSIDELFVLRRGDGTIRVVIGACKACTLSGRGVGLMIVTLTDVTRLKQSEREWHVLCNHVSQISDAAIEEAMHLRAQLKSLEQQNSAGQKALRAAYCDATLMLAAASEAHDASAAQHLQRIAIYTRALALTLGLDDHAAETLAGASVLHDVGKLRVPESILRKRGPLTERERERVQQHTIAGEQMLPDNDRYALARQIARSHHENWDGSGYPDALAGEAIPLPARIVHVVDVFDALVSARPYKQAWPKDQARRFLHQNAGSLFEPQLVEAFSETIDGQASQITRYACLLSGESSEMTFDQEIPSAEG